MTPDETKTEPTREGARLISEWFACQAAVDDRKADLRRAECDLSNAQAALAKWMIPGDAKPGEKFCMWYGGDGMVQVQVVENRDPIVTVRKRASR